MVIFSSYWDIENYTLWFHFLLPAKKKESIMTFQLYKGTTNTINLFKGYYSLWCIYKMLKYNKPCRKAPLFLSGEMYRFYIKWYFEIRSCSPLKNIDSMTIKQLEWISYVLLKNLNILHSET